MNYSSYNSLKSYENRSERVEHTYDVLVTTKETLIQLLIAEASLSNFALTNQDYQLNGYITAKDSIQESLDKLKNLISDNPNQIKRVKELEGLVEKILLNIDESIDGSKKLQTENKEIRTIRTYI
ncbi:CHASE3 domain-containing protein [Echinicola shivajiensis]|uniref:CHASE3 domain-containing protein n=1 Tax=Echinicola shivajiensis TaxID=1035916 RepID=UPI001BFC0807|nr:CHASE3 domain-containing protein [Echinicola shivajiensis]